MPKRPKVLLIAEAANPKLTSVALIGYSLADALREVADVHLVTELRNRDALLEAGFPEQQLTAIDNRKVQGTAFRAAKLLRGGESLGWTIYSAFYNFAYPLFEGSSGGPSAHGCGRASSTSYTALLRSVRPRPARWPSA